MSNILLILFPSQLFDDKIINKIINYNTKSKNLHIILWEHPYFFTKYKYHKLKLAFHRATMKKFYDDLNKKYKWDDIFDSLYYNHINKYSDKLKSIYSSASSVNRWNKFDSKKKNEIFIF